MLPLLSLSLQLIGHYALTVWILRLPESAMGESGDVEFREGA